MQIIKKIIRKINSFLVNYFYDSKKDLDHNINVLKKLGFDLKKIKFNLKKNFIDFNSDKISWHYHVFANFFSKKNINILEIGTYEGKFTNYLSLNFPNSKIYTIDLPVKSNFFRNTYSRNNYRDFQRHINVRKKNINEKNINFIQQDSFNLFKKFKDIKFDLIWVDGDHLMPQISFDIFQAVHLIKKNGFIIVDDVIPKEIDNPYGSIDSYNILESLKKKNILRSHYIFKRINKKNFNKKKFISISVLF
jgi:predicted O-methyltransferase YrrM